MKKVFLFVIVLFALCVSLFAADDGNEKKYNEKYAIQIKHADDLKVSENVVTLVGNVVLSLKTTTEDTSKGNKERELSAQKIVFNLDEKLLQASGDVHIKEGKDTSFDGDAVSLNWDTLDVVVFEGGSSSSSKNTQGSAVTLFTMGGRVSYEGETESVFFEKGRVSTRAKNPYWSIRASEIGMSNSDLFFKNATFRIGRVPFFWLPFFFYPGAQLTINPAMGYSSEKGMFLNTTYEVYGKYPRLGTTGGSSNNSSSSSSETEEGTQAALAIFSMISSGSGSGETVKDGFVYRKRKENEELSKTEAWAKKTGSYLAVFGDAYEDKGISVGFETKNKTEDSTMQMDALGVLGFRYKNLEYNYYEKLRYSLDMNLSLNIDRTSLKFSLPVYSDPQVRKDFLNRNTVFGLDAVFGAEQTFPTTYNSSVEDYRVSVTGSSNHTIFKKYPLNITNIEAYIKYKWKPGMSSNDSKTKDAFVYEITEAKLPSFTLSSSGVLYDYKRTDRTVSSFLSPLSREYSLSLDSLTEDRSSTPEYNDIGLASVQPAPSVSSSKTLEGQSFKISYTYNQTFNNFYTKKLKHSYLATSINPSIKIEGAARERLFTFTETIMPIYSGTLRNGDFSNSNFTLRSNFTASIPKFGLTYNLSANTLIYTNKSAERDFRVGKWDNKDILAHNVVFSKSFDPFTFRLTQTFKPLTETLAPYIGFSKYGVSASADTTFGFTGRHFMDASISHANLAYSNNFISVSFSNTLNHTLNNMDGYSGSQSLNLYPLYMYKKNQKLRFSQSLSLQKEFEPKTFSWGLQYNNNYVRFNYKGKDFEKDTLQVRLNYALKPHYWWHSRIGVESSLDTNFTYDFNNEYGSSFNMTFSMNFAINKFIDMRVSVSSANNSFHLYYDNDKKFQFDMLWEDLIKSFDFFGDGRKSTHFTLNSMSIAFIHYMEDWNLIMEARSNIDTVNGKRVFKPEVSVSVKWNAIPELKVETKYNDNTKEWEKK